MRSHVLRLLFGGGGRGRWAVLHDVVGYGRACRFLGG
jgi:hypothetical protein